MIRKLLISLTLLLATTAIFGGLALVSGVLKPPVNILKGAFGGSYLVPGFALVLLVGGTSANAARLLLNKDYDQGRLWCRIAGIAIIIFETVEIAIIGSPPGPSQFMQLFYFGLGAAIIAMSFKVK